MLTKIIYNCSPDALGDVDSATFAKVFENEVRQQAKYRDLQIEVTFNKVLYGIISAKEFDVVEFDSDDWEADILMDDEFCEEFRKIAYKSFCLCLD